jgi:uncharacterized protein (UPF0332 family)
MSSLKECFISAVKDEKKERKHKGLRIIENDEKMAQNYIRKAKKNLVLCDLYRTNGFDYKIPEEWFYTLYYCALAILAKFGIESRSQRCTAEFLRYVRAKELIEYNSDFIDRITVFKDKGKTSDVDDREAARYSSATSIQEINERYGPMMDLCRKAISQAEEIVYSEKKFQVPSEFKS